MYRKCKWIQVDSWSDAVFTNAQKNYIRVTVSNKKLKPSVLGFSSVWSDWPNTDFHHVSGTAEVRKSPFLLPKMQTTDTGYFLFFTIALHSFYSSWRIFLRWGENDTVEFRMICQRSTCVILGWTCVHSQNTPGHNLIIITMWWGSTLLSVKMDQCRAVTCLLSFFWKSAIFPHSRQRHICSCALIWYY